MLDAPAPELQNLIQTLPHAVRIGAGSQQAGTQGLLINAPYYNRPSAEGVYRHIMAVVEVQFRRFHL